MSKKVIISVISDLATDQRVHRTALTLHEMGFCVVVVGRLLSSSQALPERPYLTRRFKLWFHKGPLFYLLYNIRLFFYLLFANPDLLFSNDLDTLPANFFISKLKRLPLIYDSHEYFTGVPELAKRPMVRSIWKWMERRMLPHVNVMFTVNNSMADLYKQEYGVTVQVMRNIPEYQKVLNHDKKIIRDELSLPKDRHLYILQGSGINIQRGAEEAVESMQYINDGLLLIIGGGDVINQLKAKVKQYHLQEKVIFKPKMPASELLNYTRACDVGLTLDKDLSINYRFSLPNKLFDYIHAEIPVLASNLPEVRKIIEQYQIGLISLSHDPKELAASLQQMTGDKVQMEQWRQNAKIAARELNWQNEKQVIIGVLSKYM